MLDVTKASFRGTRAAFQEMLEKTPTRKMNELVIGVWNLPAAGEGRPQLDDFCQIPGEPSIVTWGVEGSKADPPNSELLWPPFPWRCRFWCSGAEPLEDSLGARSPVPVIRLRAPSAQGTFASSPAPRPWHEPQTWDTVGPPGTPTEGMVALPGFLSAFSAPHLPKTIRKARRKAHRARVRVSMLSPSSELRETLASLPRRPLWHEVTTSSRGGQAGLLQQQPSVEAPLGVSRTHSVQHGAWHGVGLGSVWA